MFVLAEVFREPRWSVFAALVTVVVVCGGGGGGVGTGNRFAFVDG